MSNPCLIRLLASVSLCCAISCALFGGSNCFAGSSAPPRPSQERRANAPTVSDSTSFLRLGSEKLRSSVSAGQMCIDSTSSILATEEVGGVCLWQVPSGSRIRQIRIPDAQVAAPRQFSGDGKSLAVVATHRTFQDVVEALVSEPAGWEQASEPGAFV